MEIQLTLDKEDWKAFQKYLTKVISKTHAKPINGFWGNLASWIVFAVVFLYIAKSQYIFHWSTAAFMLLLFFMVAAIFFASMNKMRKAFEPSDSGIFCGTHKFTFSDDGIASEGKNYKGHHSWETVQKVESVPGMILIYLDTAYAYVFPKVKPAAPDEFYTYVSEKFAKVTNQQMQP